MYMGHIGVALAGKGLRPSVPLWVLVVAVLASDLLDAAAGLAGLSRAVYPWTHSLPGALLLALAAGLAYVAVARDGAGAAVVGAAVFSHVLGDLLTSRLPAWPGGPTVGLHLYRFDAVDFALEAAVVIGGWWLYRRSLTAGQRRTWPVWAILLAVLGFQLVFQALPIS
jgi:membrane-bound metal-dependent hydrolase YbcI (DUF457 family)